MLEKKGNKMFCPTYQGAPFLLQLDKEVTFASFLLFLYDLHQSTSQSAKKPTTNLLEVQGEDVSLHHPGIRQNN